MSYSNHNERLRVACKRVHGKLVSSVNASSVVDHLFAVDVLTEDDNLDIDQIVDRRSKCRRLLAILHASVRPDSFVRFREALDQQAAYRWLVDEIDRLCDAGRPADDFDEVDGSSTSSSSRLSVVHPTFSQPEVGAELVRTSPPRTSAVNSGRPTSGGQAECLESSTLITSRDTCDVHVEEESSGVVVPLVETVVVMLSGLAGETVTSSSADTDDEGHSQSSTNERAANEDLTKSLVFTKGDPINDVLRKIVLNMSDRFVNAVDASTLAARLNSLGVLGAESTTLLTADVIADPGQRSRCLLAVLQSIDRGDAFVKLRETLTEEIAYKWLVDEIDMTCASTVKDSCQAPCKRHAQLMRRHDDRALFSDDVYGIARLDDRLYVVCRQSDAIRTFSANPPYNFIGNSRVTTPAASLTDPCDLVACDEPHRQLHVGDKTGIWVLAVDIGTGPRVHRWIRTACRPWSLSIRSGRLLVTPWNDVVNDELAGSTDGSRIFLYGVDGRLVVSVRLPLNMVPRHAVETSRGTYIVSYNDRDTSLGQVIELDSDRRVVNAFNNFLYDVERVSFQLNPPDIDPSYLALDHAGNVLVGDSRRRRVVLLDDQLRPAGVLVKRLDSYVYRICHDERNKQLFVGCFNSRSLCVFRLL